MKAFYPPGCTRWLVMDMEVLLGIDVGSTNIKCIAIDALGKCVALKGIPMGSADTMRNANMLFERVCDAVKQVMSALPVGVHILGVATSSVGCSAFFLNRLGEQVEVIATGNEFMPADCVQVTGYPPDYHNTGVELIRAHGDLSDVAHVLSYSDYISYCLSGELGRDISTAGSMSMYDRRNGKWWDEFKSITGLTDDVLGKIYPSGTQIGAITEDAARLTGISAGVPVCLGGHDYLCAAFALGCVDEGSILNVLGTYEIMSSFHHSPVTYRSGIQCFSDCHCYPERYSLSCEALAGGQLEWLRNLHPGGGCPDFWDDMYKKIDALPPSFDCDGGRELFIPRIYGEGFPVRDHGLRGGFLGLNSQTDYIQMMRAAIEGLCMYSRRMFEYVAAKKPDIITVAGGGSNGRFWVQTKADVLGVPVVVPQVPEASATGSALLAGVGVGVFSGYDEASCVCSAGSKVEYFPDTRRVQVFERVYNEAFLPALDAAANLDGSSI